MSISKAAPARRLLVATNNPKKLAELQTLLAGSNYHLLCLKDFPHVTEVSETGKTFQENASLKALSYAKQTGLLTLAEDSGLCCDALEGAPGVYSARFAGSGKDDRENNLKLLKLLEKLPDNCRGAHFVSAIALAEPDHQIAVVEGKVSGFISREIRGQNGFGYDFVFFYPPFGKNFSEVLPEVKNQVSHRGQALQKIKAVLKDLHRASVQRE